MNCRSCNARPLVSILSLGKMPLANALRTRQQLPESEQIYPLEMMLCEHCSLVQLKDIVSPSQLFSHYLYFSSTSETMVNSAKILAEKMSKNLPSHATVVEIGSNDGYLLQHYLNKNFTVIGIEPAENIAAFANSRGIPTICDFFSQALAEKLATQNQCADIIHANNVMAHSPNINDFVMGIKQLLKPQGIAIIEVPHLLPLVADGKFDTIYHEHVYYFSLTALNHLFTRHQLQLHDVELIELHGGSLRLFISREDQYTVTERLQELAHQEQQLQVNNPRYYQDFSTHIEQLKYDLCTQLHALKQENKKIAAYGASAKGAVLLNYFGIGKELIDFVVDRSNHKQGYFMPGCELEIRSVESLTEHEIDYTLLLTWNFSEEILAQQQSYRDQGGKFIIPIPNLRTV